MTESGRDAFTPKPHLQFGRYRHYSGKEYEAMQLVCHSETLEWMVLYRRLYKTDGPEYWVRPYEMFIETVLIDGESKPRFTFIDKMPK
jgi:hypothetical protein